LKNNSLKTTPENYKRKEFKTVTHKKNISEINIKAPVHSQSPK